MFLLKSILTVIKKKIIFGFALQILIKIFFIQTQIYLNGIVIYVKLLLSKK
jgi:hypothetical protein